MIAAGTFDSSPRLLLEAASAETLAIVFDEGGAARETIVAGDPALLENRPRISVIGSRRPSEASLRLIESLVVDLVSGGACIVSGAARGTDMAAHLAALAAGGATIAAPPFGIDLLAGPEGRAELAAAATNRLALISPFPRDMRANRTSPLVRNRIVAALGDAIVAGEADASSGTMHCISMAFELGRPIFFMRARHESDAALQMLHRQFIARGAKAFPWGEVPAPNLALEILRAARESIRHRAEAAEAQLRLPLET